MGRHVDAVGQKRHGAVIEAEADLHHHEHGGYDGRRPRPRFRPGMPGPQEDMVAGPDAVAVRRVMIVAKIMVM